MIYWKCYKEKRVGNGMRLLKVTKIKHQLLLSYIGIIAILCISLAAAYVITTNIVKENIRIANLNSLTVIGQKMDAEIGNMLNLSALIYNSGEARYHISQIKRNEQNPNERHYHYYKLRSLVNNYTYMLLNNGEHYQTLLVPYDDSSEALYYSWANTAPRTQAVHEDLAQYRETDSQNLVYVGDSYQSAGDEAAYLYYCTPLGRSPRPVATYAIIGIQLEHLEDILFPQPEARKDVTLLDSTGRVIFSTFANPDSLEAAGFTGESGFSDCYIGGTEYANIHTVLPSVGWRLVQTTPTQQVLRDLNIWSGVVVVVMLFLIAVAIRIYLYISRRISVPIGLLCGDMRRMQEGDMSVSPQYHSDDELGVLSRYFYNMVAQIRLLQQNALDRERQKRILEIEALQTQINPHFLYNTINSIKMLNRLRNTDQMNYALTALADILKDTVGNPATTVTLEQEIQTLESYVYIQQLRFSSFAFRVDLPEELRQCRMLRFVLQPFVENSVFHAFAEVERDVFIHIAFRPLREQGLMEVTIADNGIGMGSEDVERIMRPGGPVQKLNGIGIENVRERIRLTYGEPCGLKIESSIGRGTTVTLLLPLLEDEPDEP